MAEWQTPEPEPQFRGTFTHADIHYLVFNGSITLTECYLLSLIDSLVKAGGIGCWASNGYLAKRCRVKGEHVQKMIRHLSQLGLIRRVGNVKREGRLRRVLETYWSRIQPGIPWGSINAMVGVALKPPIVKTEDLEKTIRSLPSGKGASVEKENKVFFPDQQPRKKLPTKEAKVLAELHKKFCKRMKWTPSYRPTLWAKQFQILIDRYTLLKVDQWLRWYHKHHPEVVRMKLRNGQQFKEQIDRVISFYDSYLEKHPKVTKQVKRIVRELKELYNWPKGCETQLAYVVSVGLKDYKEFYKRFERYVSRLEDYTTLRSNYASSRDDNRTPLIAHGMQDVPPSPKAFILDWMKDVHRQISNWPDWSGNLQSFAFSLNHKNFTRLGKEWGECSTSEWKQLLKAIGLKT